MGGLTPRIALAALALVLAQAAPAPAPAAPVWCRGSVSWQQASRQVGGVVRVKARVASARFADRAPGKPTLIDLGATAPNRGRVTVVIWGRSRLNFPQPPQRMFSPGRVMCAHGLVSRRRGVARIEVEFWDPGAAEATF